MRSVRNLLAVTALLLGLLVSAPLTPAGAEHKTEPSTNNMHALGHSP